MGKTIAIRDGCSPVEIPSEKSSQPVYHGQKESRYWIFVAACCWSLLRTTLGVAEILYVPVPSDVSKEEVIQAGEAVKNRLHRLVKERLKSHAVRPQETPYIDFNVIFCDHDGVPILPELAEARRSLKVNPTNELSFTFDSPAYPWSTQELAALDAALGHFYPVAKAVYGSPAFNITVNVRKDPTISFAGLYYPSLNEMVVKDVSSRDVICHEMIHAFRDDDVISFNSYEEGMTRAAEVEVFNRLPNYTHWDENHGYTYDVYYEGLNTQVIGSQNGNFFQGYVSPLLRYQLSGYAWAKAQLEDSNFFINFNKKLYARILSDPSVASTESELLSIFRAVLTKVEGKPVLTWYTEQGVFNTNPPRGYFLYQRINQFTVDYFYRDSAGTETMQANATIQWTVYNDQDLVLDVGSGVTSDFGWISFSPSLPTDYTGRIKVVVTASSPSGTVSNSAFRTARTDAFPPVGSAGVFGVISPESVTGTLTLTPLDEAVSPVVLTVSRGAFYAPSLRTVRGEFRARFAGGNGLNSSRRFTKDASDYYLSIEE